MITFLSDPSFRRAGRGNVTLCEPLVIDVHGTRYTAPIGAPSDGGSIPAIAWPLVGHPYSGSAVRPFFLHDWMCRNREAHGLSSKRVHRLMYEALSAEGVAKLRAWTIYTAVRFFGPRFKGRPQ